MNTFTFLTNNPPLAAVTTYTSDPANPTLSFEHPTGVVGPAGRPDRISPTRTCRMPARTVELHASASSGGHGVGFTSARTPAIWIEASSTTRRARPQRRSRRTSQTYRSRRMIQNDLIADYDAFSIILRKRMTHGFQADAHYTWSRTRDMSTHSNGGGATMDNYDIWRDYGPAGWDIPHRFVASYIYDVPFLKDSSQPILKYVVAGWQMSGVTTIQSGSPVNITFAQDRANIGIPGL
jgi:hypothetical protein